MSSPSPSPSGSGHLMNLPKRLLTKGHLMTPKGARRNNPIKAIQDREWQRKQLAAAAASKAAAVPATPAGASTSSRTPCPNKACPNPNVVDGTCQTCGRVADDSDIVAEISFGENAQGGAIVQGSFMGADQGTVRLMPGIGHRRVAGNGSAEARDRALRDARQMMSGFALQLGTGLVPEHAVATGVQYYKMASAANFVQGRRIQIVVAVCLYAACRQLRPCRIMLIDLADVVKTEIFYLGRVYKKLLEKVVAAGDGLPPIYIEDLVLSFAMKLEFKKDTHKVAETAIRLVQRMERDWMAMGRRPAGICGACLIMAARMYNYRRTVREVVYIAKVTMATLQTRLDEFKELPSAKMTVDEFLAKDFLPEDYDPPAIYKKREDYQAKLKERRRSTARKRPIEDTEESNEPLRKRTPGASNVATPRMDADGFAIPPLPNKPGVADLVAIEQAIGQENEQLDAIAAEYGDATQTSAGANDDDRGSPTSQIPKAKQRVGNPGRKSQERGRAANDSSARDEPSFLDEAWREDEDILDMEMTETINSQPTKALEDVFKESKKRAMERMEESEEVAPGLSTPKPPDPVVGGEGSLPDNTSSVPDNADDEEDEFADDPEVVHCLHTDEDMEKRERLWLNQNEAYLRDIQEKAFRAKVAANGPKKQTRRRSKKPKMGEGQSSPASTPGDAVAQVMESRQFSKKINYNVWRDIIDGRKTKGPGSVMSEFTSRQTSRAGSSAGTEDGEQESREPSPQPESEEEEQDAFDEDGNGADDTDAVEEYGSDGDGNEDAEDYDE